VKVEEEKALGMKAGDEITRDVKAKKRKALAERTDKKKRHAPRSPIRLESIPSRMR